MLTLLSILVLKAQQPASVLSRFENFVKAQKSLAVSITARDAAGRVLGTGRLQMRRPDEVRYECRIGVEDYVFIKNSLDAVEFSRSLASYQDHGEYSGTGPVASTFSNIQGSLFEGAFLLGTLRAIIPSDTGFEKAETKGDVDIVEAPLKSGSLVAHVTKDGRLVKVVRMSEGKAVGSATFDNYSLAPPVAPNTFAPDVPQGLIQSVILESTGPLNSGSTVKLGIWEGAKGSVDISATLANRLLVVVDPAQSPSAQILRSLGTSGIKDPVVLSLGSGGDYRSPRPEVSKLLRSIGLPVLLILSPEGKVTGLWAGFNPAFSKQLWHEVNAVLKGEEE